MADNAQQSQDIYAKLAQLLLPSQGGGAAVPVMVSSEAAGKFIDPNDFIDPTNPGGTALATQQFSELVNTVPLPSPIFLDSGVFLDNAYQDVLLTAAGTTTAATTLLANANSDFITQVRADINDPTYLYHGAEASPSQWWNPAQSGWASVHFTVGSPGQQPPPLPPHVIPPRIYPGLSWRMAQPSSLSILGGLARQNGVISLTNLRAAVAKPATLQALSRNQAPLAFSPVVTRLFSAAATHALPAQHVAPAAISPLMARMAASQAATHAATALSGASAFQPIAAAVGPLHLSAAQTNIAVQTLFPHLRLSELVSEVRASDDQATMQPVQPGTSGLQISFDYIRVSIARHWLHMELFAMPNWQRPDYPAHSVSTGTADSTNTGNLPLVPLEFLVIRNLVIMGHWSGDDAARAQAAQGALGTISLGPFGLSGASSFDGVSLKCPGLQIVAWLNAVVPVSPPN